MKFAVLQHFHMSWRFTRVRQGDEDAIPRHFSSLITLSPVKMAFATRNAAGSRCPIAQRAAAPSRTARVVRVRADAAAPAAAPASLGTEKTGPNFAALRDINQIMATLPHRCGIEEDSRRQCSNIAHRINT